jgi:hypothetical protein
MKVEHQIDRTWLVQGNGPLRPILVESDTRLEAAREYVAAFSRQIVEQQVVDLGSAAAWAFGPREE